MMTMPSLLFTLLLSLFINTPVWANENSQIYAQTNQDHLLIDAQTTLPITPTMEEALRHGIPLEYTLTVKLSDPTRHFWENPMSKQVIRVRLSYDLLKQTYQLTNLTLQRVTNERDLVSSLHTLGRLQDLPLIALNQLETGHTYHIWIQVKLEPSALPNALRLATLFDEHWLHQTPPLNRYWTAPQL
jgi:hypothetical protein